MGLDMSDAATRARGNLIRKMDADLAAMLPQVLAETGIPSQASLNATIGGKAAHFIDLHNEVILSPEQYVTLYMRGFRQAMSPPGALRPDANRRNYEKFRASNAAQEYFLLFLKRSYLKHFTELSRTRPPLEESEIWIGQNRAHYGLLVTPTWRDDRLAWCNDRSEIRHFPKLYWTIGHVLRTGLVVPGDPDRITFRRVEDYLTFFKNVLVRASGSPHERGIAERYIAYVRAAQVPESVPLLIPELRYGGAAAAHQYRLDFCVIDPFTMRKVGFELSPWSTHGRLSGTAKLTQAEINNVARGNFEREMAKHKAFFREHGVYALIYTDGDLQDLDKVFGDMKQYLASADTIAPLDHHLLNDFFA